MRNVPSNSFRDGVLMYQCAVAGACPGGTVRGVDQQPQRAGRLVRHDAGGNRRDRSAGHRPEPGRASPYFASYPSPNDPGRDGHNLMDYRFAAPIENDFFNLISRVDYKAADNHSFFGRFGKQDDTINTPPQFPGSDPRRQRLFNNYGGAIGYDAVLSPTITNSFRYGFTKIDENNAGVTNSNYITFRFISPFDGIGDVDHVHRHARRRRRRTSSTTCRGSRAAHDEGGHQHPLHARPERPLPELVPERHRQPVVGGGHRPPQHAGQRLLHRAAAATCRRSPPASRPDTPTPG